MDRHSESDYEDISGTVTMLRVREAELVARVAKLEGVIAGVVSAHANVETANMPEWLEAAEGALEQVRELKDLLVLPE